MGIRKNAAHLSATERDNFLRAVLTLKNTIVNPAAPATQQISIFDQFVAIHLYTLSINVPGGGLPINMGHQNSAFCPWHRYYLIQFEQALQAVDPTVMLPYWDWTDHTSTQTIIFQDNFLGPNGGVGGVGGGAVQSGYFAFNAPAALPAWWPAGLAGWRVKSQLQQGWGSTLQRNFDPFTSLETQTRVQTCLNKTIYEGAGNFRTYLEGGAAGSNMHNGMHGWVGGNMGDPLSSPNDLIFYMHHCNIDRLWAMWQIDSHQGSAFYPAAGRPQGHNLNDLMWPWVGATPGYTSNNVQTNIVLPDFTVQPQKRPVDMLDHRSLGYAYDTEVIMGVALDQTGSMTGMTPDPLTGMAPNITKWEAAKRGVSALMHDCEAAYTAKEAYVVAGVETFRSMFANIFTQIFGGAHFGVVKSGGTISQANFDTNIVAQSPSGGTPLAGALSDTETNLVRAPFANLPAGEQRYLSILTDGKETAGPLLTTLGTPAFPDTIIFAMGFGVGGGWDGVDYATIANMTTKGKTAPAGVSQVFHGENAGVIDKFYTNSVAASIGYVPTSDPVFDLYPGEFVHYRFDVTDADQSFMIAAQGFDFSDKNWDFCLMAPDGSHCADTRTGSHDHDDGHEHEATPTPHAEHVHDETGTGVLSPFLVTMKQKKGRCTIFLNRNGADSHQWVGRWAMMVTYKSELGADMMVMPAISDLVLPVGAPPVKGPVYTRYNKKIKERKPVRALPGKPAHALAIGLPGISTTSKESPCAVSINIFKKTSQIISLTAKVKKPYAGQDINLRLELQDRAGGSFVIHTIAARLVAPKHSMGNAFADLKTISVNARRKFTNKKNKIDPIDLLQYLAVYENRKPGVFAIRDEIIEFEKKKENTWVAIVKNNIFPGVYHMALYAEGIYTPKEQDNVEHCCHEGPQRFSTVLHSTVALGILPDEKASRPVMRWTTANTFIVSIIPKDVFGNIALPSSAINPSVTINGNSVRSTVSNLVTGEFQIKVAAVNKNFSVSADGQTITEGVAIFEISNGGKLLLKKGTKLKIGLQLGSSKLPVPVKKSTGKRK